MNGRRMLRLSWVALSDVFLFVFALKELLDPGDIIVALVAGGICAACAIGVVLEVRKHRFAAAVNVFAPAFAGVAMLTPLILIRLSGKQLVGDLAEGGGFLMIISLVPFCLAALTGIAYWAIDIEPDKHPKRLGLG